MCYELANIEAQDKQPTASILAALRRALAIDEDYTDARLQLALGGHPNPANGGHLKTGQ
jgi:hypothetical protein